MAIEHFPEEHKERKVVKAEVVHEKFLATPTGPEKEEHWFEADYEITHYDDGTTKSLLMPGTLKDLGRKPTEFPGKIKVEEESPAQEKQAA